MVKDIAFLPTASSNPLASSTRASTSRVTLEDTLDPSGIDEVMHDNVRGEETGSDSRFLSCSTDKTLKLWDARTLRAAAAASGNSRAAAKPLNTYLGRIGFK